MLRGNTHLVSNRTGLRVHQLRTDRNRMEMHQKSYQSNKQTVGK